MMLKDKYKVCGMCIHFTQKVCAKGFKHIGNGIFTDGDVIQICNKHNCNVDKKYTCKDFVFDKN